MFKAIPIQLNSARLPQVAHSLRWALRHFCQNCGGHIVWRLCQPVHFLLAGSVQAGIYGNQRRPRREKMSVRAPAVMPPDNPAVNTTRATICFTPKMSASQGQTAAQATAAARYATVVSTFCKNCNTFKAPRLPAKLCLSAATLLYATSTKYAPEQVSPV